MTAEAYLVIARTGTAYAIAVDRTFGTNWRPFTRLGDRIDNEQPAANFEQPAANFGSGR